MICAVIGNLGTQAQKDRWLPALASGDAIAAFALTEPDVGSDATQVRATAKTVPGGYVLNGRKQWCTNGGHSAVTMGMFRTGGSGAKGVSAFLIDNATSGIVVERVTEKLGIHTSNTVDLAFDDVKVGTGDEVKNGSQVEVYYTGRLVRNGQKFDSNVGKGQPFEVTVGVGQVIKGWDQGLLGMKAGGIRKLKIPAKLGYGMQGAGRDIPPDADLEFEIELVKLK